MKLEFRNIEKKIPAQKHIGLACRQAGMTDVFPISLSSNDLIEETFGPCLPAGRNDGSSKLHLLHACLPIGRNDKKKVSSFLRFSFILLTFFFSLSSTSHSQVVYEPVTNSVYSFLERMSLKGIIQTNEEILPWSRMDIAEQLNKIATNSKFKILNSELEKDELEFYMREFANELKALGVDLTEIEAKDKFIDLGSDNFGFNKYNRFRLFDYSSAEFSLSVDPIFGFGIKKYEDYQQSIWSNGLKLQGYFGSNFGFNLSFYDNHLSGDNLDQNRKFSSSTGYEYSLFRDQTIDFDRMNANISYSWNWGRITLGKDFNYYGTGEEGKLILSDKAPSFPYLKLEAKYSSWFNFSYIHGYLNSQIIDSNQIRLSGIRDHYPKIEKYYATHLFSFTPLKSFNISLGESVVYSDKFEPIYLIPVAFFRLADHYLTDPDESAGNAQLFASFWYKNFWAKTKLYGSIFIDELSLSNSELPQALAYNAGLTTLDLIIPNSRFNLDYTKINPYVYFHADSAQSYANYGYEMGHWIGSNADRILISYSQKVIRGLDLTASYSYIRKGSEESYLDGYYPEFYTFLWGKVENIKIINARLRFELIHSLNIDLEYEYSTSDRKNYFKYPGSSFGFSVYYGM